MASIPNYNGLKKNNALKQALQGRKKPISKSERLNNGIKIWASFYRANPHRFVKEYLGINLKIFQVIMLYMMNYSNYFMYLAARGRWLSHEGNNWVIREGKIGRH